MSDTRPVGSVVFGPWAKRGKKSPEIPIEETAVKAAALVVPKTDSDPELDGADFPNFGAILAGATTGERQTETRVFDMKGKRYKFEIYVDGREDAERWSSLSTAMMHGYALEGGARLTGQPFLGVTETFPVGNGVQKIVVKDLAYLGSVKVLSMVLKRPEWGFNECLMMGHELGQGFMEVCNWAAAANGVTEDLIRKMEDLEKNAPSLSQSGTP